MFELSALPQLNYVKITKEGNFSGVVEINDASGEWVRHHFSGSLPFSKARDVISYQTETPASSSGEDWLAKILLMMIERGGNGHHPTYFKDALGNAWKGDQTRLPRLVAAKRFRFVDDQKYVEAIGSDALSAKENKRKEEARIYEYCERLARPEQAKFRKALLTVHSSCAVSGCKTHTMLEAAHIEEVKEADNYDIKNGILLRADLHRLFDTDLMAFNPDTGQLVFATGVNEDDVKGLEAKICNPERFRERWAKFLKD
ncbi:MAG: HNH endonuclease signature motif containing protein [Pseudomonadota bacterium]